MSKPHVLIFPLPLQGPVNSMLKLAELLCLQDIQVTFLNSENVQQRLRSCTDTENYFKKYENFRFETVPDGLPEDNSRNGKEIFNMLDAMNTVSVPIFRDMMVNGRESDNPVSCIIADGIFMFAVDIAKDIGVPLIYFDTISPCALWTYLCLPKLTKLGEVPFKDDNLDELIKYAPGMEGILRRRDLPSFCRAKDVNDHTIQLVLKEAHHIPQAYGLIFNTFEQLEGPILSQMRTLGPKVYDIGPLHFHTQARLAQEASPTAVDSRSSSSIWKEDKSCITWLDAQPKKSVLYVSIGSLAVITKEQLLELWHGLVSSGSRFLWVRRPGSVIGLDLEFDVPLELAQGTKERGCIVNWAPQEKVLEHPAVGAFLTHSGWNSTLECIVEGKPMICWPYFVDQQVNSRYVDAVWKIGLDMKDTCDRKIVEKMVREIMELRKDEFLQRTYSLSQLANASVSKGGSSFVALDRLVKDIKSMYTCTK